MATKSNASKNKEKRNWLSSFTKRKTSKSQQNLHKSFTFAANGDTRRRITNSTENIINNDNDDERIVNERQTTSQSVNENLFLCRLNNDGVEDIVDSMIHTGNESLIESEGGDSEGASNKHKEEKNVFQRFRKMMGLHFSSLRFKNTNNNNGYMKGASGTQDASDEFLTRSPIREQRREETRHQQLQHHHQQHQPQEEPDLPFTHNYKRFIVKKWLDNDNRVMYKASSEMLNQVWYWGEISRRDAQKQLTDKPTGSFLVRDSETYGSHFTLSFRIINVTLHYRLEYHDNYWHFEELQYESIVEMIEDILYRCTNVNFVCYVKVPNEMQPPFPVILKYPLSRYLKMPTLQDLCRRVIQRHSTIDEIRKLPIPSKLLDYLSEKRELVFQS